VNGKLEKEKLMKKLMMMFAALAAVGMVAGCFTSATAYTEKTNPDGTKTVSRVSIIGTGDKASQVAAEGMFADGASDDLGAGVKNASASQQSTGVKETLEGVGSLLGGLGAFMARTQGVPVPTIAPVTPDAASVASAPVKGEYDSPIPSGTVAALPGTGIGVVVLGNRATCGYCAAFWARMDAKDLAAACCGAVIIDADKTDAPNLYQAFAPADGFNYPLVRVYEGGQLKGEFVSRGDLPDAVFAKIKAFTSCK
jgi:hypothetical protein